MQPNLKSTKYLLRFDDVCPTMNWTVWAEIEAIKTAAITTGCGGNPPLYCPTSNVTRAQMALFLARAIGGLATYVPAFPIYPPETAWMRVSKTNIPGLILKRTENGSRIAFMPADIDRQFGRYNLPDDVRALPLLFDHLLYAADLTFHFAQPGQ